MVSFSIRKIQAATTMARKLPDALMMDPLTPLI